MQRVAILVLVFLLGFVGAASAADGNGERLTLAGRSVVFWRPDPDDGAKHPIILFSHGFMSCATQSRYLMQALAAAGYWVFAPNHADSACPGAQARVSLRPEENVLRPDLWNEDSYRDRRDDMIAVAETLRTHPDFAGRIDFAKLGLAGHSLGGYTVLALAGAWASWRMPGVKAVLALSPYSAPFNIRASMGGLSAPVMFQGGTRDYVVTPYTARVGGSYDSAPMPKYFLNLDGAGHLAWTDRLATWHDPIIRATVSFFDHYVKGEAATADLVTMGPGVAGLRYASELGSR